MQVAPLTDDETERLKALYDYDILDTEAEAIFDELTQLASDICETPIALISLVDPDRQWFKSQVGLNATETSRDIAFCSHAIHQKDLFQVEDTLLDNRFSDNPLVTADPNIRFYAGTPLITPDGQAIGTLCAIDTKPKKLSDWQAKTLEVLGRNVISQMELRKRINTLKVTSKNKSDFLSAMSHELRTPLNAIIGFSRLLLNDKVIRESNDETVKYLHHIDYSGKRLLSVINEILDIGKIESGMMTANLKATNLSNVMHRLSGMLIMSAIDKHIDFQYRIDPELPRLVMLDEGKVEQIITNLVNNAIKYSPNRKKVELTVRLQKGCLILEVQDQGEGISLRDQARLFTKYQQLGSPKSAEGYGLGLAITKGLVESMQGGITVSSTLDVGSLFTVTLPLILPSENTQPNELPDGSRRAFAPNQHILVVEDNEINQAVIEAMLESFDLDAIFADTGEEAIEIIEEQDFDLVLMDIQLPGINGVETSQRILEIKPDTPIVALSADIFEKERNNRNDLIFREFLTKPIELDDLEKTLLLYLP